MLGDWCKIIRLPGFVALSSVLYPVGEASMRVARSSICCDRLVPQPGALALRMNSFFVCS